MERDLQTNISDGLKNPKQNISKLNPAIYNGFNIWKTIISRKSLTK